jgi:two-component system, response regulator PdtaR
MRESKRVILATEETKLRLELKEELARYGYLVVAETGDGMSVLHLSRQLRPDLVLMDLRLSGMDGIEVVEILTREQIAPVVLLAAESDPALIERAKQAGVVNYLIKPWRQHDLYPALEVALARFEAWCAMQVRTRKLEEELASRKVVEQAKGLLMEQYALTEQQAYRVLRHESMNARKPLRTIAEAVLEMNQIARRIKASQGHLGRDIAQAWVREEVPV